MTPMPATTTNGPDGMSSAGCPTDGLKQARPPADMLPPVKGSTWALEVDADPIKSGR
jgi:hypothetical protein